MNLLGAALYDPAGAVSKVTTSLLAMTAFDTTNLRVAFTVPAHGLVLVRMACVHHGSTTTAQVLLGVLEGSTLRGRAAVSENLLGTAVATTRTKFECSYVVTGLSAGAVNWDAAYGVEIVSSAGGAIKYGGPNNTTTDDAFGAFIFEVWDPRPLKTGLDGGVNVTQLLGTAWLTPGTAGTPDVNAKLWNGLTTVALPLVPTTAGRTLDVTATGEAGIDWANIGGPTTTVDLSNTTIKTTQKVDVETIKTNPVVNGGTITFPSNATLASTTNITAGTVATATNVTTVNGLAANVITAASMAADASAEIADAVWDEDATGHQTQGSFGQAIGDPVADTNTIYKAVVTDAAGATVGVDVVAVKADTAAILADTGTDGVIVASIANNAITAAAIATAAIDADAIAADAIGASEFAQAAADKVWATAARTVTAATNITSTGGTTVPQTGDNFARLGAPAGASVSADVAAVKSQIAAIETDTAEIGAAGAGLTAINLPNQTMDIVGNITGNLSGSVGSVTGLTAANLDTTISSRLAATDYVAPDDPLTESYAALAAEGSLAQLLYEIRALLAENSVSGVTVTTKKLDGSTTARTYTINSAVTPTEITTAS